MKKDAHQKYMDSFKRTFGRVNAKLHFLGLFDTGRLCWKLPQDPSICLRCSERPTLSALPSQLMKDDSSIKRLFSVKT